VTYAEKRQARVCVRCLAPVDGTAHCGPCAQINRQACTRRYQALLDAGRCVTCTSRLSWRREGMVECGWCSRARRSNGARARGVAA
jgi:hypothetical protein